MRRTRRALRLWVAATGIAACSGEAIPEVSIQREQRGDTTFVTISGEPAVSHQAEVDLVVGRTDAPPELMFAEIADLHVDSEGRILVFDHMLRSVRRYSPEGAYIDEVGSPGQGPGEFEMLWGLSTASDGRVLLGDYFGQVHVFDGEGRYLDRWKAPRESLAQIPVVGNDDGSITIASSVRLAETREYRLYFLGNEGELADSMTPHVPWLDEVEQGHVRPTRHIAWGQTGFGVTSVSSRLGFEVFRPNDARVVRVQRTTDRARFGDAEREEWTAYVRFIRGRSGRPDIYPDPPEFKPAFRQLVISRTGQLWVVTHQPAVRNPRAADSIMGYPAPPDWLEPFRAEVYTDAGDYLASVAGPRDLRLMFASNDTLWGVMRSEYGVPAPVRLVLDRALRLP